MTAVACRSLPEPSSATEVRDIGLGVDLVAGRSGQNITTSRDWLEVWQTDVRPTWRGGVIEVQGSIADSDAGATAYQYAAIEVRVIGYSATGPSVLRRGSVGGVAAPIVHELGAS